ncbi:MAG: glucose-6-phosphate dehydrogenase [Candidatus Izemoplasmataceae bacterium]
MKQLMVIFGATGNLMIKKLLPALASLYEKKHLSKDTKILCVGRQSLSKEEYLNEFVKQVDHPFIEAIFDFIEYIEIDFKDPNTYELIKPYLNDKSNTDVIYYLAVPPTLFPVVAKGLALCGLVEKGNKKARIVFEKPFGEDLKSAQDINKKLWSYFDESQIYRIDHYLGKEMIQNILVIRFGNRLFEQAWHKDSIESITILAKEKETVLSRGNYYDKIGAFKDMVQSHLLQMVALITMNEPKDFSSLSIKDKKVDIFNNLVIDQDHFFLGQYEGYKNTDKIDKDSTTETFVYFKATLKNHPLSGVPIYIYTGKALDEKRSEIIVTFKPHSKITDLWPDKKLHRNKLIIRVAPEEGVYVELNVKEAGLKENIIQKSLDYCHSCQALLNIPEAYEKLLLEVIKSHTTLFTRWDEIETTWRIIESLQPFKEKPYIYKDYQDLKAKIIHKFEEAKYVL